jgi:hypothetical protein
LHVPSGTMVPMLKLTKTLYVDPGYIVKVQYFLKGSKWHSPIIQGARQAFQGASQIFDEPTLQIRFKKGSPMWLVGSEAEEAWKNWTANQEPKS